MRAFNYKTEYQKLLTPEIVTYLSQIHEQKGQQNLFIEAQKDVLTELLEIAKIQSTEELLLMNIDKDKPLPDHTKLDYDECCVLLTLKELFPDKYNSLEISDKYDWEKQSKGSINGQNSFTKYRRCLRKRLCDRRRSG